MRTTLQGRSPGKFPPPFPTLVHREVTASRSSRMARESSNTPPNSASSTPAPAPPAQSNRSATAKSKLPLVPPLSRRQAHPHTTLNPFTPSQGQQPQPASHQLPAPACTTSPPQLARPRTPPSQAASSILMRRTLLLRARSSFLLRTSIHPVL